MAMTRTTIGGVQAARSQRLDEAAAGVWIGQCTEIETMKTRHKPTKRRISRIEGFFQELLALANAFTDAKLVSKIKSPKGTVKVNVVLGCIREQNDSFGFTCAPDPDPEQKLQGHYVRSVAGLAWFDSLKKLIDSERVKDQEILMRAPFLMRRPSVARKARHGALKRRHCPYLALFTECRHPDACSSAQVAFPITCADKRRIMSTITYAVLEGMWCYGIVQYDEARKAYVDANHRNIVAELVARGI